MVLQGGIKNEKILLALMLSISMLFIGCSQVKTDSTSTESNGAKKQVITIATSSVTHQVAEVARDVFNETNDEYEMELKLFDDAVAPNTALAEGSIDATFHQHKPYMNEFNESHGTNLQTYGPEIFASVCGLYSNAILDISEIEDGMTIAIPNDPTNRSDALLFLADLGIIKPVEGIELLSVLDIEENPYNLEFIEMERLGLANAIDDCDMSVSLAQVVKESRRDATDSLAQTVHAKSGIFLVVNEVEPWADLVIEALTSDEVRDYLENGTGGTLAPLF